MKRTWQERISRRDPFYLRLADGNIKFFKSNHFFSLFSIVIELNILAKKQILVNIMMTYTVYHPDPGYSQGMTDMLTSIVYVLVYESISYFAFYSLMNHYMSSLFDRDPIEIHRHLHLSDILFQSIDHDL